MDAREVRENENAEAVVRQMDTEMGVPEWWTPLMSRRPGRAEPRVTEDGLKVPSWWTDDETESQQMLAAQGLMLDG